jgi:hypothetical protein
VLVGAIDDLLITRNDVLRAWAAASSRPIHLRYFMFFFFATHSGSLQSVQSGPTNALAAS